MRYHLGQIEYKWTHAGTDMEQLWIQRELGDELFNTVEDNRWKWILLRSNSTSLPSDIYCRTLIQVESNDDKLDTHFILKFPQAKPLEKTL
jgi:hypothetical protein